MTPTQTVFAIMVWFSMGLLVGWFAYDKFLQAEERRHRRELQRLQHKITLEKLQKDLDDAINDRMRGD